LTFTFSILVSRARLSKKQVPFIYDSEADILNMDLFGKTAADWRAENQKAKGNIKDYATLNNHDTDIHTQTTNTKFVINHILHQMCHFLLTEINTGIS
jgi:hypothetical protein